MSGLKADGRGSAPFRRDCSQDCSQAAEQHPTHVDNSGISAQPSNGDGRSWTTCPLLRIRGSAPTRDTRRGAERPRQHAQRLTDLLTRPGGAGETARDTGDDQRGLRLVSETRRNTGDVRDVRRMAHNPEVAGSNPAPATKARGPFSNRKRASGPIL